MRRRAPAHRSRIHIIAEHDWLRVGIAFQRGHWTPQNGSDLQAIAAKRISVTPLRLDMTDEPFMTRLLELFD